MNDEPETTAVAVREASAMPLVNAALVTQTMETLKVIRQFVAKELVADVDYGVIPGTGSKPTLLLPGAQKVCMLYNCYPEHTVEATELPGGHVEYRVSTILIHRATGQRIGAGVGSCSTMEGKYRYRNAARKCPQCGKEAIIKGKAEYGGGWICFKKKDGCGAKFGDNDPAITSQTAGRVENEDIADSRNTVLKMAKKRAHVDAALGLGCLTELFTQDFGDPEVEHEPPRQPPPPSPPVRKPAASAPPVSVADRLAQRDPPASGLELKERAKWVAETIAKTTGSKLATVQSELDETVQAAVVLSSDWSWERLSKNELAPMWQAMVTYFRQATEPQKAGAA